MNTQEEIKALKEEIERLKDMLRVNGIPVPEKEFTEDLHLSHESPIKKPQFVSNLSLQEKVALFQNLFKGREDVFAKRWFSNKTGKSGYQPVCLNEWDPEYCNKTKYKCSDCPNRKLKPLEYEDYYKYLEGKDPNGKDVIGVYAILPDDNCNFLCCDFDDKNCEHGFKEDVKAYIEICKEWEIPAYIERSRSGNGAHVWILFTEPVKASMARRLGKTILTEAMERKRKISFKSYDRFFPNQDTMPNGGFGNLVALPLQGQERDIIVISMVRSNDTGQIGFLRDLRRMNVAMTRARMKLLIIGNSRTLSKNRFYSILHSYIQSLNKKD